MPVYNRERSRNYSGCQLQIKSRFSTTAQAFQIQMFMICRYVGFISKEVNECSSQTQQCHGPDRSHKEEKESHRKKPWQTKAKH